MARSSKNRSSAVSSTPYRYAPRASNYTYRVGPTLNLGSLLNNPVINQPNLKLGLNSIDRRRYHPGPTLYRTRPAPPAHRHRLTALANTHRIGFASPQSVAVCAKRKTRREVLHALRLTSKGSGASRKFNQWSRVSC